ncbi:MAG: hypothetical protein ACK56F_15030 [bacterium]
MPASPAPSLLGCRRRSSSPHHLAAGQPARTGSEGIEAVRRNIKNMKYPEYP